MKEIKIKYIEAKNRGISFDIFLSWKRHTDVSSYRTFLWIWNEWQSGKMDLFVPFNDVYEML